MKYIKTFESNPHRFEIGDYVKYRKINQFGRKCYNTNTDHSIKIYKLLDIRKEEYGKVYVLQNIKTTEISNLVNIGKHLDKISEEENIMLNQNKFNL